MGVSLFNIGFSSFAAKAAGGVWRPKESRISVGRDVAALTSSATGENAKRGVTIANADDVRFTSKNLFAEAKSLAAQGISLKNFRSVDSNSKDAYRAAGSETGGSLLPETDTHYVSFSGGMLRVYEKGDAQNGILPKLVLQQAVTGDARLTWNEDGSPKLLTGSAALTGGTLKALGDNELLIRKSAVDVEAAGKTTVFNLSNAAGAFSGGQNVTYMGTYQNAAITGGAGNTRYAGYFSGSSITGSEGRGLFTGVFEKSAIATGDAADDFSGYFSAGEIDGGNGDNLFRGLFLDNSTVTGGKDKDRFSGRFIDSSLEGGDGDNSFGFHIDLNKSELMLSAQGREYQALGADFIDSVINAGDGDDEFDGVILGGSVSLGDGNNTVRGVFKEASVSTGEGDDDVAAMYSYFSVFDSGAGSDSLRLATAVGNTLRAGEGKSEITLGVNKKYAASAAGNFGGDNALSGTEWQTADEKKSGAIPWDFGEIGSNNVDASIGENTVRVHNGEGVNTVQTGDKKSEEDGEEAPEKAETEAAETTEETPPPPQAALAAAVARYAKIAGSAPLESGVTGAVIQTGAGEDITLKTTPRSREKDPIADMHRITRTSDGFGRYNWVRSLS